MVALVTSLLFVNAFQISKPTLRDDRGRRAEGPSLLETPGAGPGAGPGLDLGPDSDSGADPVADGVGLNHHPALPPEVIRLSDDCFYYGAPGGTAAVQGGPRSAGVQERPTTGTVSVLVMPVYFPDQAYTTAKATLGSRWSSATTYYTENSFNQLAVAATVQDWLLANGTIAFYGDDDSPERQLDLYRYVLDYWDPTVDFSSYHYIYITYAGDDQADDTHLWPCVWTLQGEYALSTADGVSYDKAGFVGEFTAFGTYCHEFGHSLGLVDYYDTSSSSNFYAGYWTIMAAGNYNDGGQHPAHMCAWSKFLLGWIPDDDFMEVPAGSTAHMYLDRLETTSVGSSNPQVLYLPMSDGTFYLVEFRDDYGNDAYLPDHGILVARIDPSKGSGEGQMVYMGGNCTQTGTLDRTDPTLPGLALKPNTDASNDDSFVYWDARATDHFAVLPFYEFSADVDVVIDRASSWGAWNVEVVSSIDPDYMDIDFPACYVGDVLFWAWDTPWEGSGSQFRVYKDTGSGWTNALVEDDIWQDGGYYRVLEDGAYRIRVRNDNLATAMTLRYKMGIFYYPYHSLSDIEAPSTVWKGNEFTVTCSVTNLFSAWDTGCSVTATPSAGLQYAAGETGTRTWPEPYLGYDTTFEFCFVATSSGARTVTLETSGVYGVTDQEVVDVEVTTDPTPPVLSVPAFAHAINTSTPAYHLTWTASDPETGIDSYEIRNDSTLVATLPGTAPPEFDFTLDGEGTYQLEVKAFNRGGSSTTSQGTLTVDWTAPTLTIAGQGTTVYDNGTTHRLTWTTGDGGSGSGVKNISLFVNDSLVVTLAGHSTEYALPTTAEGTYRVRVQATDHAGNALSRETRVVVDHGAPGLDLAGAGTTIYSQASSYPLQWTGSDAFSGVKNYSVHVDATLLVKTDNLTLGYDLALLEDGLHAVTVVAEDFAGNLAMDTRHIHRDTGLPTLALVGQDALTYVNQTSHGLSWTAGDGGSGLQTIEVLVNGSLVETLGPTATSTTIATTVEGLYAIQVRVTDRAGNAVTRAAQLLVDRTGPACQFRDLNVTRTPALAITGVQNCTLNWTGSDGFAGIREYRVYVNGTLVNTTTLACCGINFAHVGDYRVTIVAVDQANNWGTIAGTVRVLASASSPNGPGTTNGTTNGTTGTTGATNGTTNGTTGGTGTTGDVPGFPVLPLVGTIAGVLVGLAHRTRKRKREPPSARAREHPGAARG